MSNIRILPDHIANQIAAGEVIERPAAVIKELVENSLDAGASRIAVEFREGGRALMRVEDNGSGMTREDVLLALKSHATSKISEAADLGRLTTFGFRGEALPSIASVARCLVRSRTAESEAGVEVLVNGGVVLHVRECGRPVGTSVEVAHLFHPVPARRKFLKSDPTESAHIAQCVRLYALAHPRVAFTLCENGREAFRSPECTSLRERVAEIFGRQLADLLLPIEVEEFGLRIRGLIGRPGVSRASRHEMLTFVNGRPVDSRTLNFALMEGYRESVPKGRYPLAFIFFECDPAAVDVNVHPAKREVRFRSENAVRGFVIRSLLQTLSDLNVAEPALAEPIRLAAGEFPIGEAGAFRAPGTPSPLSVAEAPAKTDPTALAARTAAPGGNSWRFVGTVHGAYAILETTAGFVLLDRRAACERIWFERLQGQWKTGGAPSQRLLLPVPVELDSISTALLLDRRIFLAAHGFEVAEFGARFFRIEAIPTWMEPTDAESFLRDLLGALREGQIEDKNVNLAREQLARLAAARAARLSASLGAADIQAVLADLFSTRAPLTSPTGRPTFIEITHHELARRFEKS